MRIYEGQKFRFGVDILGGIMIAEVLSAILFHSILYLDF